MLQEDNFDKLLAQKEQECKDLQIQRVQSLDTALRDSQSKLKEQQEKFNKLKEDFMFNLKVLEERDRDLERYDAIFAQLKVTESCKQAEISDLQIQIDKMQELVTKETKAREEVQLQYQHALKAYKLEIEKMRSSKDSKIDGQREEYQKLKQNLQHRVQEVEGQLALQKQEMLAEFDAVMKCREHEFTLQADEMSNAVLTSELKVKLLSKEMQLLKEAGAKAAESLLTAEKTNSQLEKELQRKDCELKDVAILKDVRIKELEDQLNRMEIKLKKEEEIFQRKHCELDRFARERDTKLATVTELHSEQIRELENQIRELQMSLDTGEMEKRRMEWSHADATKEKEDSIEKLRGELSMVKTGWDTHIAQISKETVAKDMQIKMLQDQHSKLKTELSRYKDDVEKYKQQLVRAAEREQDLERLKVQAELDWQHRCEEIERTQYAKSEQFLQSLSQARDQVSAELQEKECKLQEVETLVQSLTLERDQAISALSKHGVFPEQYSQNAIHQKGNINNAEFPSDVIRKLQEQNVNLRTVIAQMRKEMEILSEQTPANQSQNQSVDKMGSLKSLKEPSKDIMTSCTPEYVKSLENEVHELKQKCRKLEGQLEDISKTSIKSSVPFPNLPVTADITYLQNHTHTLNETIAGLRAEKVSTAITTKKHEARVVHLNSLVVQLTQQLRQKQVEINQLRYELTCQQQRTSAEIVRLNERISELELQLVEAHREADEYIKGNLQQNAEAVALGDEVSALKLDLTQLIKELQGEILQLRQQLVHSKLVNSSSKQQSPTVSVLQGKLKQAARYISKLSREKQQLIEMGNRLRAELLRSKLDDFQPSVAVSYSDPVAQSPRELAQEVKNRLSTLEHLQYQLTTQELQYAQLKHLNQVPITVQQYSSESENGQNAQDKETETKEHTGNMNPAVLSTGKSMNGKTKETTISVTSQSHFLVPEPSQTQPMMHGPSAQSELIMSSYGADSSIQDIWQMLEGGSSPSISTPQNNSDADDVGVRKLANETESALLTKDAISTKKAGMKPINTLQGHKVNVQSKAKPHRFTAPRTKQKHSFKTAKIRNYNIRD
ncbi:coiled-coil domain-containing protein 57 isoform X2 [Stegostoma tigrinum]|uniref:coiled-coil domain-containing protein 57 isoform X2 n=1 Tax=Stegostoma tigrinum TaxID=3053191 RepID=UPI00286FDFE5|nr:coiled-coil domain-containing protein 57 isoform X2 [Stegostoma tigrinum]